MARLFVLSSDSIGESFQFDGTTVIGRSSEADVTLAAASMSRRHARLVPRAEPGVWGIVDLDSRNGVFVGGERVRKAEIRDGDTFVLGDVELRLRDEVTEETSEADGEGEDLEFEDDFEEELAEAPAPRPSGDDGGLELEFGEDLDEALSAPVTPSRAPSPAEAVSPDRAGARASADRAARRQAAVGASTRPATGGGVSDETGRPVLQYAKTRSGGTDIAQLGGASKLVVGLGALLVVASAAYGAFLLAS
ncbi:MAG: FHA domain-containing protein [Planctomycetota bacterium]|nr:FHA domain-containing protein [Planctomycetota bacterium]